MVRGILGLAMLGLGRNRLESFGFLDSVEES